MNKINKTILFISIITISSFLLSGCTTSEEKINQYNQIVSDADLLIEAKEYKTAIEKLSDASELIPSRIEAIERIVNIFVVKNRLEDATKIIDESGSKLSGKDKADLYTIVGDAYYQLKDFDKALYNYQLAKGNMDSNQNALLGIAKVYIQKGNIEGAKSLLKDKYEGDIYIEAKLLSSYVYSLNDIEKAKLTIKDIEPGEQWRERYTQWNDVLDSLTEDQLFNGAKLAKEYLDNDYPYLVIGLLEPQRSKMTEYVDGIYLLGKAYYEYGQYQKSIDLLENNTTLSDLNQYIYWILARDYYLLNNLDIAFSYYDSAIAYAGDKADKELYQEYLDLLFEGNLTEKAIEVMRNAERIYEEPWVRIYYMNLYTLRKDSNKFEYHTKLINYDELDQDIKEDFLYLKGRYLIQESQLDEAKKTLDLFWELDRYDSRYNLLFAQLSFQEGNLEDARIYSRKAIEYDLKRLVTEEAQKLLAQID